MTLFLSLGGDTEGFIGKHKLITLSVMKQIRPTTPFFAVDIDLGTTILQLTDAPQTPVEIKNHPITSCENPPPNTSIWKMFFNGASSRESVGVGVVIISPIQETIYLSCKLEFEKKKHGGI
jgi:hypothetical protein